MATLLARFRFKSAINRTVVETFADEIIRNGFGNAQLEIDDGYESSYGDFDFDPVKFSNATEMIATLHDKVLFA